MELPSLNTCASDCSRQNHGNHEDWTRHLEVPIRLHHMQVGKRRSFEEFDMSSAGRKSHTVKGASPRIAIVTDTTIKPRRSIGADLKPLVVLLRYSAMTTAWS